MCLVFIFFLIFLTQSQLFSCLHAKLDSTLETLHPFCAAEKSKTIQNFHSSRTLHHCLATFRCFIHQKYHIQKRKGFYHAQILYPVLYHSKESTSSKHANLEESIFPYGTLPCIYNQTMQNENAKFVNVQRKSLFSGFPTINTRQLIVFKRKKGKTIFQTSEHVCYQRSTQFLDFSKAFHTCVLRQPTYLSFVYDQFFENMSVRLRKRNIFVQFLNLFTKNHAKSTLTFLNLIGAGGESEVWRACRNDGHSADVVAIKVIRQVQQKEKIWNIKKALKRIKLSVSDSFSYLDVLPSDLFHLPQEILTLSHQKNKNLEIFWRSLDSTKVLYNYHVLVYDLATKKSIDMSLFVKNLEDYIKDSETFSLDPSRVAFVAYQMYRILQALSDANLIWMDCKPSNFLYFQDGSLRLGDAGLIKVKGMSLTHPGPGTLHYRPPEAYTTNVSLYATETWSVFNFGISLYFMVTKKIPWMVDEILEPSTFLGDLIEKKKNIEESLNAIWSPSLLHFYLEMLVDCLQYEPSKRLTLDQLGTHPFWKALKQN